MIEVMRELLDVKIVKRQFFPAKELNAHIVGKNLQIADFQNI